MKSNYDNLHSKRIEKLKKDIFILNELCLNLNPYENINQEQAKVLKDFDIFDHYDPFFVTNKILIILEDSQEELFKLQNTNIIQ